MSRTFSLWCAVEAQQTFESHQLEADPEGAAGSVIPRESELADLRERLRAALAPHFHVVGIEIEVDQDLDGLAQGDGRSRPPRRD